MSLDQSTTLLTNTSRSSATTESKHLIPFDAFFPIIVPNSNFVIERCSYSTFSDFAKTHYNELFMRQDQPNTLLWLESNARKNQFYATYAQCFCFKDVSTASIVGVFLGGVSDPSTFYLRSAGILKTHQSRGIWTFFLKRLFLSLESGGIDRAEGDVSPSNHAEIHVFNKLGFKITGFRTSERWGAIIHFTKYLSLKHERVFEETFCLGGFEEKAISINPKTMEVL